MAYKPKDFSLEAVGYYDGLMGRMRNPTCVPEPKRWTYNWTYDQGSLQRSKDRDGD